MLLLGASWKITPGSMPLSGHPKADDLDAVLDHFWKRTPDRDNGLQVVVRACHPWNLNKEPVTVSLTAGDSDWWIWGFRVDSNEPPAPLVESNFRIMAAIEFGEDWSFQKKKRLAGLRKKVKRDLAEQTPMHLTGNGAVFFNPKDGRFLVMGSEGVRHVHDLPGRMKGIEQSLTAFLPPPTEGNDASLLRFLKAQGNSKTPWPTGIATLKHKNDEKKDTAALKGVNFSSPRDDVAAMLAEGWMPTSVEVQFGEGSFTGKGTIDETLRLTSLKFPGPIKDADPSGLLGWRLDIWLKCSAATFETMKEFIVLPGTPLLADT